MYRARTTSEVLTDIFTPRVLNPHSCVEGLPRGCVLQSITLTPTGIVELVFHHEDHLEGEIVDINVIFRSTGPS